MGSERTLPWDWYPGQIPANVEIADGAYVETSHSFFRYRSEEQIGASFGKGASMYKSSMLDVGLHGRVVLGDYAMLQGARIICDNAVTIGPYTMLSWLVLVMDSYRLPRDAEDRRSILRRLPSTASRRPDEAMAARPVHIGSNCWIGFGTCVLPGVTIGEAAIVGARSVVAHDVEPYTVVAGNPARFIRRVREEDSA
jgi:acetyltransferase-like isoleucine patch superfamily enzyme